MGDVTKLLDDRWFPLMEASIPAEGFINGMGFPTVADLVVLNIKTGYMPFGAAMPRSSSTPRSRRLPTAPPEHSDPKPSPPSSPTQTRSRTVAEQLVAASMPVAACNRGSRFCTPQG